MSKGSSSITHSSSYANGSKNVHNKGLNQASAPSTRMTVTQPPITMPTRMAATTHDHGHKMHTRMLQQSHPLPCPQGCLLLNHQSCHVLVKKEFRIKRVQDGFIQMQVVLGVS